MPIEGNGLSKATLIPIEVAAVSSSRMETMRVHSWSYVNYDDYNRQKQETKTTTLVVSLECRSYRAPLSFPGRPA